MIVSKAGKLTVGGPVCQMVKDKVVVVSTVVAGATWTDVVVVAAVQQQVS